MRATRVSVSGFSSNTGKTTLLCDLLRNFPGWEAIKLTRGHYRSCGKDPHACCVSHLLSDAAVVRSGRKETYAPGKDTGLYWDSGASNVHWVIASNDQVEDGIRRALASTKSAGVFIEGNSFLDYLEVDFAVMVARAEGGQIKASARRALAKASAIYLSDQFCGEASRAQFRASWLKTSGRSDLLDGLPLYTREELPQLVARIQMVQARAIAAA